LTHALVDSKAVCIAYETIQKKDGSLPLLMPMSEVAGRMAIQPGAKYLEMAQGGEGVLVDVAIDQGGCFETSKATTHTDPTYIVDNVIHYCVANMPGAVAKTATLALTNATLPYALEIANKGWKEAMKSNQEIKLGANVIDGKVCYNGVTDAFNIELADVDSLL